MILRTALTLALLSAAATATPALAKGDDGETGVEKCKRGEVYDERKEACVPTSAAELTDDALLANAKGLAYSDRFDEAIAVLNLIGDQDDTDVQTMLGYSTRMNGDYETGMKHYHVALRLDVDNTVARSYMGAALAGKGDLAAAEAQLREIEARCGTGCDDYAFLRDVMAGARPYDSQTR
ncbi:M48 family metallopeptidase [Notoacmeibacter sp. MSK16QG-6]|uniref:tetratricopeptide repeat protein n=1 Tax=Notoacmeibacter sp. MSK16QG-6 TaxID=2957982 RepID=UPI00209D1400|nr:hypothetical protein [Notoacmeibacter sp. MSK16QG-6]MCP1199734.1 hypothetical protein [Notoacmeibacter sp. MSK16QG-6]